VTRKLLIVFVRFCRAKFHHEISTPLQEYGITVAELDKTKINFRNRSFANRSENHYSVRESSFKTLAVKAVKTKSIEG
jgi:hypothetical protein